MGSRPGPFPRPGPRPVRGGLPCSGQEELDVEAHGLALLAAKGDVVSGRAAAASWALFTYERSNSLKLLDSGAGGPAELAKRFQSGSVMYGLCRLRDGATGQRQQQQHIVLINWVGENVSDQRRQACAGHLPAIRAFFKEANLVVKASRAEEVTQEGLERMMALAAPSSGAPTKKGPPGDQEEQVGTNYKKTNPALEILHTKRSSFWAQAEREEEERREEERKRAQEERRRWERQRMEEERRQAAERERRIQEKEQLIQEQRKLQAQREAEERRNEEARRQQEVAALALQRSHSPRDFFQQRERLGSASEQPSSRGGLPGAPRRPFLRIQRSLTESSYIFRRPDPPHSPSSPGAFLPSRLTPGAAPLPSPRQPKPPPPISPKPGPGAPHYIPAPPTPTPPENGTLPPTTLTATGSSPTAAMVATTSPLAEANTPEGGGEEASPELGPPSPSVGTGGAPLLGDPPQASSLPPPHSLSDSPQVEQAPLGAADSSQAESLPHTGTPAPLPCSPDHLGGPSQAEGEEGLSRSSQAPSPPTNGLLQEEGLATDDLPAPPAPSQTQLAPSSGHKGMMGAEEEGTWPISHRLGPGEQVDSPAGTKLPGAPLRDHGAGEGTQNGDQPTLLECTDHTRDPGLQTAEA